MEATVNASIEPELQSPPPRRVAKRQNFNSVRPDWLALFMVPHALVGIGALFVALFYLFVLCFGITVPGTASNVSRSTSSKGTVTYNVTYNYRLGTADYSSSTQISREELAGAATGARVNVRTLAWMPGVGQTLFIPGGSRLGTGSDVYSFALAWNAVVILFYLVIFGGAWKEKSLVKKGLAVRGRVLAKRVLRGKGASYLIKYEYTPVASETTRGSGSIGPWASGDTVRSVPASESAGGRFYGEMTVPKPDFEVIRRGDEMTVLYDPKKPKKSILFATSAYVPAPYSSAC